MGMVWTTVFPSNDKHVIISLVVGFFFIICFALWENFAKLKHPLTPRYVFTSSYGRDFTAPAIALAVVNMFYYSSSILWPTIINSFYSDGGANWRYAMILSLPQGLAIAFGATLLMLFGSSIKHWHWQLAGSVFIMVLFGSLLALCTPTNKGLMVTFVFLSQSGYGWAIYLAIAVAQMGVEHRDLGLSGGIAGVSRFAAGSSRCLQNSKQILVLIGLLVGAAVYTTILTNEMNKKIASLVPAAAADAGVAQSRIAEVVADLGTPDVLLKEFGPKVAAAVQNAVEQSKAHGIRYVHC